MLDLDQNNKEYQIAQRKAQLHENNTGKKLQDNRPQSAAQLKQTEALAKKTSVQRKANNTGLPDQLKSGIENISGHSMDDVKVHYNSAKPAQLNAHAYAQGTDIHIAAGQEKHLPHEAWHVVQQKQGRVRPTMQMKGKVNINDDQGLEREADMMGARAAVQRIQRTAEFGSPDLHQQKAGTGVVQAIMSVAAFKMATSGRIGRRSANIGAVDASLHTYITSPGPAKLANVLTLIGDIDVYRGGDHAAAKIAAANNLRVAAVQEELLLTAIGAPNGGILDDFIARAGGAGSIPQLVHLANTTTAAHAHYLPALVTDAGGAAGLGTLGPLLIAIGAARTPYLSGVIHAVGGFANHVHITNLVAETGAANFMNIPGYIHLAGGSANIPGLIALLHRNVGNPGRASHFLAATNGNAVRFTFLCAALPHFTALAAPPAAPVATLAIRAKYPLPANIMGQYGHYNERHRAPTFAFNFQNINLADGQTIWPYATTAADIVTYLEHVLLNIPPAVPGPPVPGAYPNQPVGAGGMQARLRINNPTGVNNYSISQFFPESGTPGTFHFTGLEMVGIGKVLNHIP